MVRHKIKLSMKPYRKCKNLILEFLNQSRLSCSYTFYIVVITGSAKWVNTWLQPVISKVLKQILGTGDKFISMPVKNDLNNF